MKHLDLSPAFPWTINEPLPPNTEFYCIRNQCGNIQKTIAGFFTKFQDAQRVKHALSVKYPTCFVVGVTRRYI